MQDGEGRVDLAAVEPLQADAGEPHAGRRLRSAAHGEADIEDGDQRQEDAVEQQLEQFRTAFAKYEDAKEGETIGDGDFVNFDYKGQLNGQPLSDDILTSIQPEIDDLRQNRGPLTVDALRSIGTSR